MPMKGDFKLLGHHFFCIVTSENMGEYGGIQRFVLDLTNFLTAKGFETFLISAKDSGSLVSTRIFNANKKLNREGFTKDKLRSTTSLTNPIKTLLLFTSTTLNLMHVCRKNQISIIHAQDVFFSGLASVVAHKVFKIPLIIHIHGPSPYFFEYESEATKFQKIIMCTIARFVIYNSDLILATDVHTKSLLSPFLHNNLCFCIPTPIQTELYNNENARHFVSTVSDKGLVFGFIGRLCKQKNLRTLLSAFAAASKDSKRKISLVLVGDGPENNFLRYEVKRLVLDNRVSFVGTVNDDKKIELLESFDVFIFPSIYEGCPIALLEAMASGKGIITSDIPAIRQIVRDNKEGILVDPYNVKELERAIIRFLNDPFLAIELGQRARERARLYDFNLIFHKLLKIYGFLIMKAKPQIKTDLTPTRFNEH